MSINHQKKPVLIESQFFPSLPYFAIFLFHDDIIIDQHEHFVKASYRNRCEIATPDGLLTLSIPLASGRGQRRRMKDVGIFNVEKWQAKHWNSLSSAYRRSPYFEYYEMKLEPFFKTEKTNLLEFNTELLEFCLSALKVQSNYRFSDTYIGKEDPSVIDLRTHITPNKKRERLPEDYTTPTYHQVFNDRNPFFPNLSILDLLFNEGPRSAEILRKAWAY